MIIVFLTILVAGPLIVLIHELGHAIAVLVCSKSFARIFIGDISSSIKENFKIGRLSFHFQWAYFGLCAWDKELKKWQKIVALAGGPIASLLVTCLFAWLMGRTPEGDLHNMLHVIMIGNLGMFLLSAFPMFYPKGSGGITGMPSDGLKIWKLVKGEVH
ncbi:hypothetical protein [Fredinandcohnia sp. 179-A 10B2 NHS]|uniref:hypothetical protein n=1 Tax=Fredinandcohnia sp. 179-A 10B2 NHS TaxID=3235176 RepID=UPI0039A14E5B